MREFDVIFKVGGFKKGRKQCWRDIRMVPSVEDTRVSWLKDRGLLRGETHKTHAQCIKIVLEMISCTVWFIKSLYKPLFKYKNTIITLLDANTYIWCFPKPQSCSDGIFIACCYELRMTILWIIMDLFSFVFWRKLKTPKSHFEINWPLWER